MNIINLLCYNGDITVLGDDYIMHRVIEQFFICENYENVEVNIEDMKVYIKANVVYTILNLDKVDEITSEQMNNMINQLYNGIVNARPNIRKSVLFACGKDVKYITRLYTNLNKEYDMQESKVIFDMTQNRVMQEENAFEESYNVCMEIVRYINSYCIENGIEDNKDIPTKVVIKNALKKTWAHLIIINILIFFSLSMLDTKVYEDIMTKYSLNWKCVINDGEWYRLLTSIFLHWSTDHLFNNMISLWAIGSYLENKIGRKWIIISYFVTGIIAGLTSLGYNMKLENNVYAAGASGAIFGIIGMLLAILVMARNSKDKFSGRRLLIYVLIVVLIQLSDTQIDNAAHIGGILSGVIMGIMYSLMHLKVKKDNA